MSNSDIYFSEVLIEVGTKICNPINCKMITSIKSDSGIENISTITNITGIKFLQASSFLSMSFVHFIAI